MGSFEMEIKSSDDVKKLMQIVESTRSAKEHNINERSSRSHCIVALKATKVSGKNVTASKFSFVDLA